MKTIVIMQPTYLPWIGYFDLMDQCDQFIFLDHVQFARRSWQQRNRIKTAHGEQMLTVPVLSKGLRDQSIREVRIDSAKNFTVDHVKSIHSAYAKAPFYRRCADGLEEIFNRKHEFLCELNIQLIQWFAGVLGLHKECIRNSSLGVAGKKTQLLLSICRALGATCYLSAVGSREYIEEENLFPGSGIELVYHQFHHPVYPQLHGEFIPYLSILDLVMNVGGSEALAVIRSGRMSGVRGV